MKPRSVAAAGLVALLACVSCGSSSSDPTTTPPIATDVAATGVTETGAATDPAATAPADSVSAPSTTSIAAPAGPPEELADLAEIVEMSVTTPPAGNGEHPLLAWEPVESAAGYALTLTRPDGQTYWAWTGTEPQTWLGGSAEQPTAGSSGPFLAEPLTLRVVAVNADGLIFAASRPVEIAP